MVVIDIEPIRERFSAVAPFLDERGRRLVAAAEAFAAGYGGIAAVRKRRQRPAYAKNRGASGRTNARPTAGARYSPTPPCSTKRSSGRTKAALLKLLDSFLTRPDDRALFNLPTQLPDRPDNTTSGRIHGHPGRALAGRCARLRRKRRRQPRPANSGSLRAPGTLARDETSRPEEDL